MRQPRQDVSSESITLVRVRISGEDERVDPKIGVGFELREHLVRISHDRGTTAATRPADSGPEMVFHETVIVGGVANLGLAANPGRSSV